MNSIREKLEKKAHHWMGESINDQLAGREPTSMITVEMRTEVWEHIWSEDAAPALYEALKSYQETLNTLISQNPDDKVLATKMYQLIKALALADRKEE